LLLTTALAVLGETETAMGKGGAIVIAAAADLVASATEVAVSVTATFAGTLGGGVKVVGVPVAVLAGATDPQAGEHGAPPRVRDHTTPALLPSYWMVAVKD